MRKVLLLTLAIGLLAACSGAAAPSGAGGSVGAPAIGRDAGGTTEALAKAIPAPGQPASQPGSIPVPAALDPTRALILTASISMRAQDPWGAADRAQAVATSLGGDVMSLSQSGKGDDRAASLVLRVPAERFNDVLRQLRALSDVEILTSNVDSKDVTEQFVDLEARLRAKQAEEARYLALLARAEKIEDILRIDQSLAQVRTQIEQLTGQVNSIRTRTTFSTISLSVTPAGILPPTDPKVYDPTRTVERAIATLGLMLRVVADLAIWLLVFGWIPLLILGVALGMQRMRKAAPLTS